MDVFMEFWDDPSSIQGLLSDLDADRMRIKDEQAASSD